MLSRTFVAPPGQPSLAYVQAGRGPDVVLIHGALTTLDDMAVALLERLASTYRVTLFDRPGHGLSGSLGLTGSPWRQAEALAAAAGLLGVERPVVVGHSHGGAVALAWALQFPEATRGVLALAPIAFPEVRLEHLLFAPRATPMGGWMLNALAHSTVDRALLPLLWRAMFLPQPMPDAFAREFPFGLEGDAARTLANGEDAALLNRGLLISLAHYPRCEVPVRIIGGRSDHVVNNRLHGELVARLLPKGEFMGLPGLGHMLHHFAKPAIDEAIAGLVG